VTAAPGASGRLALEINQKILGELRDPHLATAMP
jgi:hypothetical protein